MNDIFKPHEDWKRSRAAEPAGKKFSFVAMLWLKDGSVATKVWTVDNIYHPEGSVDAFIEEVYKNGYVMIPGDHNFDAAGKVEYGNRFVYPVSEIVKIGVVFKKVVDNG